MESRTSPGKTGSVRPLSGLRGASERHCSLECRCVAAVEDDIPVAEACTEPLSFVLAFSRFPHPRQEFVCQCFLSLV
jgi:hypothetical protein